MIDNFNPSEQQIEQFITQHGDDLGNIEPELMASFMAGDIELEAVTDSDTGDEDAATAEAEDASEEASQASDQEEEENVAVKDDDSGADAADQKADKAADDEEPEGILAKDGKNIIPYSALEKIREDLESIKTENQELKTLLEARPDLAAEAEEAAAADQEAGDTKATELFLESLDDNMEEDYPGITEKLKGILQPLFDRLNKVDELIEDKVERDTRSAAEIAQDNYNESVQELEPRYATAINEDKDEFWKWFDAQPSYVRAAETSGEPTHFADVVKSFYDQHEAEKPGDEPAEKREPKVDTADVKKSVDKAKGAADKKEGVPSLSTIPGGSNPEHDENEALLNMSPMDLADKLQGKTPEEIEVYMSRVL